MNKLAIYDINRGSGIGPSTQKAAPAAKANAARVKRVVAKKRKRK